MTYASNLSNESVDAQFLVVLKPRRKVTGMSLVSGSVYSVSFTHGHVAGVEVDGTALAAGGSSSLSAGQFYFDTETSVLYVRTSGSTNPSGHFVTAAYELYIGTTDAHWYRVPTDSSTREVYYEPLVQKSALLKASATDAVFGYLPIETATLVMSNTSHFFQLHAYDSSFNQAEVKIYHWLGDKDAANFRLVFNGLGSNLSFSDSQAQLSLFSRLDVFSAEYRHASGSSFFGTTDFPALDPNFLGRPIRTVFGVVEGFVPVNVDYDSDAPGTSDNRDWVVMNGQTNLGSKSLTVPASPACTATRTYVPANHGIQVGDSIWLDKATDEFKIVTTIGANYVEHTALASGAAAPGDLVKRSFVGNVTIVQQGVKYQPLFGRDYTENTSLAGTSSGFSFTTSLEANLSLPSTLSPNDKVYCRVYGKLNTVTLGGPAFGSNDASVGCLSQAVVILFQLLKSAGLAESEIDTATFTTLQGTLTDTVGFAVPQRSGENFPTYKDLIAEILQTLLLRLFTDSSNLWTVVQLGPVGSVDKTLDDTEIQAESFEYDFDYSDVLSHVVVEYAPREVASEVSQSQGATSKVTATSSTAEYLHKIKRQKTFPSLHYSSSQAQTLANRLGYLFGERRGILTVRTHKRFFDTLLGDVIQVSRTRLPGYSYDEDTERTRELAVLETQKGLAGVSISIDDQKGIQDNSGSW